MMELADMQDLGSCAEMRWGSNPHARTSYPQRLLLWIFFMLAQKREEKTTDHTGFRKIVVHILYFVDCLILLCYN